MIARLTGQLVRKTAESVIVEVGGVGYLVTVSQRVLAQLPDDGQSVVLEIHTQVREDAIQLFGFLDLDEKQAFEALIGVSGIGPRAAISILSGIEARELAQAVCSGNLARLCLIPGIGKKKAERLILDLKDRLMPLAQPSSQPEELAATSVEDLRSALSNLGFKGTEVERAVGALRQKLVQGVSLEILLPEALKQLRG